MTFVTRFRATGESLVPSGSTSTNASVDEALDKSHWPGLPFAAAHTGDGGLRAGFVHAEQRGHHQNRSHHVLQVLIAAVKSLHQGFLQ